MSDAADDDGTTALARSQAARRRRVIDAALRLANVGGYEQVQMRDVAAEAGVALGTVYRYFTSKERLLLEAMAEQQEDLLAFLQRNPIGGPTPALRVVAVLARCNRALGRHPDVTAAMVRAQGACREENADVVRRVTASMHAIITGAIGNDGAAERRVARVVTQVWLSSLIGWAGGVDPISRVDEDLEAAVHLLLP